APALRGGARPALARNLSGAAHHRDRSDQGDRSGAGQGSPPRSQAHRRRRRRRGGGGGGGLNDRQSPDLGIEPGGDAGLFRAPTRRSGALKAATDEAEQGERQTQYLPFPRQAAGLPVYVNFYFGRTHEARLS